MVTGRTVIKYPKILNQNLPVIYLSILSSLEVPPFEITPRDRSGWVDLCDSRTSPLSVPSIGIAFQITSQVLKVDPGSPAEGKIAPNERITAVELFLPPGAEPDGYGDKNGKMKKNGKNETFQATEDCHWPSVAQCGPVWGPGPGWHDGDDGGGPS